MLRCLQLRGIDTAVSISIPSEITMVHYVCIPGYGPLTLSAPIIRYDTRLSWNYYPGTRVPFKTCCTAAKAGPPASLRPVRMLHQEDPKGAGECPAGARPRGLQARLLHACLLSAAALSRVDAQFASQDANCTFASFATRLTLSRHTKSPV